jgi:hypothetical protein
MKRFLISKCDNVQGGFSEEASTIDDKSTNINNVPSQYVDNYVSFGFS